MSDDLFAPETVTFDQLVGEGKKFRDPDALAKGKVEADKHIDNLQNELAELRGELQTRLTVEAMLEKLQKPAMSPTNDQRNVEEPNLQEPGLQINLAEEVQRLLEDAKKKDKAEANLSSVRQELKNRFGADYNQKLVSIADDLGVSKEFLTDMAKTSPAGFLKLVDSVAKPDVDKPITPPDTSRNGLFVDQNAGKKNAAYYRQLRKENPNLYFSRKIQQEMHQQAIKMGPAFYQ